MMSGQASDNLKAAIAYAKLGFAVFPVRRGDKVPITEHGLLDATRDIEQIKAWWADTEWNVAIRTGEISGIIVLDVDPRHGGLKQILELESKLGPLPLTCMVQTGGGGYHWYLKHPGFPVKNAQNLWPGIDLRGDGGYVVAPYSFHASGKRYEWKKGCEVHHISPGVCPDWLLDRLRGDQQEKPPRAEATESSQHFFYEGERHKMLLSLAGSMHRRGMDREAILAALLRENEAKCVPPKDHYDVERLVNDVTHRYASEDPLGSTKRRIIQPSPSPWDGLDDPDVGRVSYVIEPLVPAGTVTLIAADWKTGKTLLAYQMLLDITLGRPAFGSLSVGQALPVAIFQMEMPLPEDMRRLRKLAIGSNVPIPALKNLFASKMITLFNQPQATLTPEAIPGFHAAIRDCGAKVVLFDSAIACFAGADLNDNSTVRSLFAQSFIPLSKSGITTILLHHHRKISTNAPPPNINPTSTAKSAVLGAQTWGAAAGRTYSLERIVRPEGDDEEGGLNFNVKLTSLGSWTPDELADVILRVEDTPSGEGTVIRLLSTREQIQRGGITAVQNAAVSLARIVRESGRIARTDALARLQEESGLSRATAENAQRYAVSHHWISVEYEQEGRARRAVFAPGSLT